ncbi:MAG: CCA tRNA nucleotidyltransferase [Candidatus Bathyarchaeota archaeon]|nr:MAG: CCA tRNA nucleotidyltransferase [Candidatus Bathyarchaeota archaeon]
MTYLLSEVCAEVLKKVTPSHTKKKRILILAKKLTQKTMAAANEEGIETEVRVEGSIAKDTWLSEEPDIDIFMRVPTTMPREAFGTTCLRIARKATEGFKQIERFAEHPYLEAIVDKVRVNIVPCYRVERGEWISAADRTPFHTDYIKPLLDEQKCGEVRLLKRFMTGIGVYGAEIKIGGFSGYLCEILILNYGTFFEALKSIADWKEKLIIDYAGYYKGREEEAEKIFEKPLLIVDPIDKGRNVAGAVKKERLDEFVAAARAFLKTPRMRFFYPQETKSLNAEILAGTIKARGSTLIFIKFEKVDAVPDVLWGQLYKSQRSLQRMLQQHDFNVTRSYVWSNEENLNVFLFEAENRFLPLIKKHLGPPLRKKVECERFLQKHLGALRTISGPRVEAGRWVVEKKRKHVDVMNLLLEKLRDGGRSVGVAKLVSKAVARSVEILVNEEILTLYSSNIEFAKSLTEYLEGKPRWLV